MSSDQPPTHTPGADQPAGVDPCPVCGRSAGVERVSEIVLTGQAALEEDVPRGRSSSFTTNLIIDREFRWNAIRLTKPKDPVPDLAGLLEFPPVYVHRVRSIVRALFSEGERQRQIEREKAYFHRPCERWLAARFCRRDEVAFIPGESRAVSPAEFRDFLRDGVEPLHEFETCDDDILQAIRQSLWAAGWEYVGVFPMRYDRPGSRRFKRHLFRRLAPDRIGLHSQSPG